MNSLIARRLMQQTMLIKRAAHAGPEGAATTKMFKQLTWVGVPTFVIATAVFTYNREMAHLAHYQRPEYKPYAHMYVRTKAFPWRDGNHVLFHNPKANPVPGVGYEEDWEH